MRFEELDYRSQLNTLYRFRDYFNKNLFDNKLKEIPIYIDNCTSQSNLNAYGKFVMPNLLFPYGAIYIDFLLINVVSKMETQRKQIYLIANVILHEMIHQYCYENGIDDEGHNSNFINVAEKHGLHSVYKDDIIIDEHFNALGLMCICNFKMYETIREHKLDDDVSIYGMANKQLKELRK